MAFALGGDKLAPLLARLKLNADIFRVQVVVAPPAPPAPEKGADDGGAE